MIFFYFFFYFGLSKTISLNNKNYKGAIKKFKSESKSLVIKLFVPNDITSISLDPIWNNVESEILEENLAFLEIDCNQNSDLCYDIYNQTSYPQIIWYDVNLNQKIQYNGIFTEDNVKAFIKNQLAFPFTILSNQQELKQIITESKQQKSFSSIFVIYYTEETKVNLNKIKKAAHYVRNSDCKFYIIDDGSNKTSFSVFREPEYETYYSGTWSQKSIDQFVRRSIFPTVTELTDYSILKFKEHNITLLLAFLQAKIFLTDWVYISQYINTEFQFAFVDYSPNNLLAKYLGIDAAHLPQVVLYDVSNQKWINYKGDFTDSDIGSWLKSLKKNGYPWKGQINSFVNDIKVSFFLTLEKGGLPFLVFLSLVILVLVYFIKSFNTLYLKRKKKRKSSEYFYTKLQNV